MKKRILALVLVFSLVLSTSAFAMPVSRDNGVYEVPVYLKNFYEDVPSMGDVGLRKIAKAVVEDGKVTYTIFTSEISFLGKKGGVDKLYVYETDEKSKKEEVKRVDDRVFDKNVIKDEEIPYTINYRFEREFLDEPEIIVAMWVGAMGVEKKGKLELDWSKAKKDIVAEMAKDLEANNWAYPAVKYVLNAGYFKGYEDGTFGPKKSITRGQFLTVIGRIMKVDKAEFAGPCMYEDVKETAYYAPYVKWAKKNNLFHEEGGTKFMPDKALSREEMAYIMDKYLKLSGQELEDEEFTGFKDESEISDWAKESVNAIAKKGVVHGDAGKFDPKGVFTRAQVAQVLYNMSK